MKAETTRDILHALFGDAASPWRRRTAMRSGTIALKETRHVTDPREALAAFLAFGGEGWLCVAGRREIRRFSPEVPLPSDYREEWPLSGEAAKGVESLHVARSGEGWCFTTLRAETPQDDPSALVMETLFQARDGKAPLRYETAWLPAVVSCGDGELAGLEELRPTRFRFAGFGGSENGPDEDDRLADQEAESAEDREEEEA